jgi:hypothetical protein
MTSHHRIARTSAVLLAAAATALVVVTTSSSASTPAVATSFTRTITGTAMHSLDARVGLQIVANSGGGVTPSYESGVTPPPSPRPIFEAGIDLPKGAKVTAVSFTVTPGDRTGCLGEPLLFGSYVPQDAIFTTNVSFTTPGHPSPCQRGTFTKTGSAIATVVDGRHYVVQWRPQLTGTYPGDPHSSGIFHGARVQYTCTSPCVP